MSIIFFSLAKEIGENKLFNINDYDKLTMTLETLKHDIACLDTIFPSKPILDKKIQEENIIRDEKEGAFIKLLPKDVKELFEYKKQLVREKDQHLRYTLEEKINKKNKEKIKEKLKQKTGAK